MILVSNILLNYLEVLGRYINFLLPFSPQLTHIILLLTLGFKVISLKKWV